MSNDIVDQVRRCAETLFTPRKVAMNPFLMNITFTDCVLREGVGPFNPGESIHRIVFHFNSKRMWHVTLQKSKGEQSFHAGFRIGWDVAPEIFSGSR